MTNLKDRGEGFEQKFAFDEELRFKAIARRNRLLGLWAAERLGKMGEEADAYARTVVMSDFKEAGDEDVLRKVAGDLSAAGHAIGDQELRRMMSELLAKAAEQVQNG